MAQPLRGVRVLEVASSIGVAFCGKQLAEFGADVLLLEPPGGSPVRHLPPFGPPGDIERAPAHLYFDAGKRSAVVDIASERGRDTIRALVPGFDVVLHGLQPLQAAPLGLLPAEAMARWPAVVFAALTPFGLAGPWADTPAVELTIAALDGYMNLCGEPGRQPLANFGHELEAAGGLVLTAAVMAALAARERDGRGDYADVSLLEANTACMDANVIGRYGYTGTALVRAGNANEYIDALRCADGLVFLAFVTDAAFEGFLVAMGHGEWIDDPDLETWEGRGAKAPMLKQAAQAWCAGRPCAEVVAELQDLRVPCAATATMAQLLADPQVAARGFLREVDHPVAGRLQYPAAAFHSNVLELRSDRAPLLGEHQQDAAGSVEPRGTPANATGSHAGMRRLPLEGVRIVDLTQVWAAPYCTELLAELGADVIHIESPTRPNIARWWGTNQELDGPFWEKSSYFGQHNRGKRSLVLDLAHEEARDVMRRLVRESDILINNFSRRVMETWGFTFEAMSQENGRLVYATMPSYGSTGPYRDYIAFGDALQAACGIVRWRGYSADEPIRSSEAIADPYAAFGALSLLLAGLREREDSGTAISIDLSQRDNAVRLIGDELIAFQLSGREPAQFANAHPSWAPHRAYRCAGDDRWVTLAVRTDEEWLRLCEVLHLDALAADADLRTADGRLAQRDRIDAALEAWTAKREAAFVEAHLLAAGIPAAAVRRPGEILQHPQLQDRGFFTWIDHPVGGRCRYPSSPLYLHGLPNARTSRRAPLFNEHTHEILRVVVGLTESDVAQLEAIGAVGGFPVLDGTNPHE